MEQQTVTIAKAGIHASLNARSSVLAAANPIYGQYDKTRRPQENIGLPDSLLSRFDLLFIVLDQMDPSIDRTLSEHVIRSHQYRRAGTIMEPEPLNAGNSINLEESTDASEAVDTPVWIRGSRTFSDNAIGKIGNSDLLTKDFLRKYIHYAKSRISPVLSEEAMENISNAYASMRARQSRKNLPVTARTLETIIRLSTAAAKARLSSSVDNCDVEVAMELMNFVMFHEIGTEMANVQSEVGVKSVKAVDTQRVEFNKENERQSNEIVPSIYEEIDEEHDGDDDLNDESFRELEVDTRSSRFLELQSVLDKFMSSGEDVIPLETLMKRLNHPPIRGSSSGTAPLRADPYRRREVVSILFELERQNKVLFIYIYIYIYMNRAILCCA